MSLFKRCVGHDVTNVFLNLDEFADWHMIDDVRLRCIVDKDMTEVYPYVQRGPIIEGVFHNTVTLYVRAMDMERPVEGELLRLDGSLHLVESVSDEMGVYVIIATENRQ